MPNRIENVAIPDSVSAKQTDAELSRTNATASSVNVADPVRAALRRRRRTSAGDSSTVTSSPDAGSLAGGSIVCDSASTS